VNTRELILDRVRCNQPAATALPEIPGFDRALPDPWAAFAAALERMGGQVVGPASAAAAASLDDLLRQRFPTASVIVSATPEVRGTREIASIKAPGQLEDVDVGVVRAAFGVAETGSVWLSEREYGINALGFLPQHLVVLLDPGAILPNLHHAYRQPGFFTARYAALMTGPSATADIEGILIRGAQGIRSLTVISVPPPAGA
jgi:L-lactate dehydrogenase complex protein LldG